MPLLVAPLGYLKPIFNSFRRRPLRLPLAGVAATLVFDFAPVDLRAGARIQAGDPNTPIIKPSSLGHLHRIEIDLSFAASLEGIHVRRRMIIEVNDDLIPGLSQHRWYRN